MKILGFHFPDDPHYFLERDMWCERRPDGTARIGITSFGVHISGNFFMCRPKPVGTAVLQGATIAIAELNKSVVTIKSPVSGEVLKVNPLLQDTPEIIERDPYGSGWLAVLQPTRWDEDLRGLVSGDALENRMSARMRLENVDFDSAAELRS